jgi:LAO/AO transport system kinase
MKAGLMEIADIFVVNKSDRDDAERFARNLKLLASEKMKSDWVIPIVKTSAIKNEGIEELIAQIEKHHLSGSSNERKTFLLAEKVWRIIEKEKMKDVDRKEIFETIKSEVSKGELNVYQLAKKFL